MTEAGNDGGDATIYTACSSITSNVNCHKFSFLYFIRSSLHCMYLKNQLTVKAQMYKTLDSKCAFTIIFVCLKSIWCWTALYLSVPDSISLKKFSMQFSKLQNLELQTKRTIERRIRDSEKSSYITLSDDDYYAMLMMMAKTEFESHRIHTLN